jgi:hypothetical protein
VDMINVKMIDRFQGEHMVYHSFDSAMDDPHNYYPPEFLNTLTPNGLPPHVLKLKIGCHVILLRNIDPANGLCNGTRLVIVASKEIALTQKLYWVNTLENGFSYRVYLCVPPMKRCSFSNSKESSFLYGLALQ